MKTKAKCFSKITENIYLGNRYSTSVITGIDVIVSIGCKSKCTTEGVSNFKVSVPDSSESDMTPFLSEVTEFIHVQICEKNANILVHCQGGINRSPIVVVAYLARYHMSVDEAVNVVRCIRSAVRIQKHYLRQVNEWLASLQSV
jgi:protein-tyrosine phosphatase